MDMLNFLETFGADMKQLVGMDLEYTVKVQAWGVKTIQQQTHEAHYWLETGPNPLIYMISIDPHVTDVQTKVQSNLPKLLACDGV